MIIHCGGCAEHFFSDNFHNLNGINLIIIEGAYDIQEKDCSKTLGCQTLKNWIAKLRKEKGFRLRDIVHEQEYELQYFPTKVMYHYVLAK